jgi:hypothetical protein
VLLVAILLALPAIAACLLLFAPSGSILHVPTNSHFGVRTRVDFDAAPAGTTLDLPRRHDCARIAPAHVERPVRVFHDMVETVGTARWARAPSAIA